MIELRCRRCGKVGHVAQRDSVDPDQPAGRNCRIAIGQQDGELSPPVVAVPPPAPEAINLHDERKPMREEITFGEAIERLKKGDFVARWGWNGRGMWLGLQRPDENSMMSLPYIYMCTVDGRLVPWLASQTDMLAEDWHGVEIPHAPTSPA